MPGLLPISKQPALSLCLSASALSPVPLPLLPDTRSLLCSVLTFLPMCSIRCLSQDAGSPLALSRLSARPLPSLLYCSHSLPFYPAYTLSLAVTGSLAVTELFAVQCCRLAGAVRSGPPPQRTGERCRTAAAAAVCQLLLLSSCLSAPQPVRCAFQGHQPFVQQQLQRKRTRMASNGHHPAPLADGELQQADGQQQQPGNGRKADEVLDCIVVGAPRFHLSWALQLNRVLRPSSSALPPAATSFSAASARCRRRCCGLSLPAVCPPAPPAFRPTLNVSPPLYRRGPGGAQRRSRAGPRPPASAGL